MDGKKKQPLGIELVKRGIVTEDDIAKALDYQRTEPKKKIGNYLAGLRIYYSVRFLTKLGKPR